MTSDELQQIINGIDYALLLIRPFESQETSWQHNDAITALEKASKLLMEYPDDGEIQGRVAQAIREEREACAGVCDNYVGMFERTEMPSAVVAKELADLIRRR